MRCAFITCGKTARVKGLCSAHYEQQRCGKELRSLVNPREHAPGCKVEGCKRPYKARGFCDSHYTRWYKGPDPKQFARNLKHFHALTLEGYNMMLLAQGGVCAVCGAECRSGRRLAVDHSHETGEIRGLLCMACNTAIGLFNEDSELMEKAMRYLDEPAINARGWKH